MTQFLSLLETGCLWFSCITELDDPFEGSLTRADVHRLERQIAKATELRSGAPQALREDYVLTRTQSQRSGIFVNCWYEGDHESAALWQQVARHGDSIAIQTTFGELVEALQATIYAGSVLYLDYEFDNTPKGSVLNPFFCKRSLFRYEREARLLVDRTDPRSERPEKGLTMSVDVEQLIKRLVLAPGSGGWVGATIRSVLLRYGVQAEVVASAMDAEPFTFREPG